MQLSRVLCIYIQNKTVFKLIPSDKNKTLFAISYTDAQSGITFYLKPWLVNGVKTIVAVQDTSPDAYFLFTISPTSYTPPSKKDQCMEDRNC